MIDLEVLDEQHRFIIETARSVAREENVSLYLVGGPVRDLLLGRATADIDFMADASAVGRIAESLGGRLGLEIERHDRFLTRKLVGLRGEVIDLATMRCERYERAGALPTVRPGALDDDMRRRDFTINAMAVELRTMELFDPFGGVADLRSGTLRVLHEASFLDDPTRIVRAARFSARLGFALNAPSFALAEAAIAAGACDTLSRERVWREILLLLQEPNAESGFGLLEQLGFLPAFFGTRAIDPLRLRRLLLTPVLGRTERELAALAIVVSSDAALDGSPFRRPEKETIVRCFGLKDEPEQDAAVTAGAIVSGRIVEQAVAASSARNRFRRFEEVAVKVTTARAAMPQQLDVEPGPHLGRALRETHVALALGEVAAQDAASFARRKALEYLQSKS